MHSLDQDLGELGANFYFAAPVLAPACPASEVTMILRLMSLHLGAFVNAVVLVGAVAQGR